MTLRGLYALTPAQLRGDALLAAVGQALEGGAMLVQYRAKEVEPVERAQTARALVALCAARGARLIVNDDIDLAIASGAHGAHLGRDDGALAEARARLGKRLLGASCYDQLALARTAVAAGADYVAFGSVYTSRTKPGAVRAPISLFAKARDLGVPLCAIGGITLAQAAALRSAGADLLAVIADLFEAPDIRARAEAYTRVFQPVAPDLSRSMTGTDP